MEGANLDESHRTVAVNAFCVVFPMTVVPMLLFAPKANMTFGCYLPIGPIASKYGIKKMEGGNESSFAPAIPRRPPPRLVFVAL